MFSHIINHIPEWKASIWFAQECITDIFCNICHTGTDDVMLR